MKTINYKRMTIWQLREYIITTMLFILSLLLLLLLLLNSIHREKRSGGGEGSRYEMWLKRTLPPRGLELLPHCLTAPLLNQ